MLRGPRVSPSTERLWHLGLGRQKAAGTIRTASRHRSCALACLSPVAGRQHQQLCHDHHKKQWGMPSQRQFFSTAGVTTGVVKEKQPTTTTSVVNTIRSTDASATTTATSTSYHPTKDTSVLVSAAKEAQRLSDLAAKSRPVAVAAVEKPIKKPLVVDPSAIQSALESADALLIVTLKSSPLLDAIQNREEGDAEQQQLVASVHRAFVAVTSWCLDVLPSTTTTNQTMEILTAALNVTRRARQLQLPFYLPLYSRLMTAVAESYNNNNSQQQSSYHRNNNKTTAGGLILEIAGIASHMLGPNAIPSSHFFRDALTALARRHCFGDVVTVLQGMEGQHGLMELDFDTTIHLLAVLEVAVEQMPSDELEEEMEELMEILNLANPFVWKTVSHFSSLNNIVSNDYGRSRNDNKLLDQKEESATDEEDTEKILPVLPSWRQTDSIHGEPSATINRRRPSAPSPKKDELFYFQDQIYQSRSPKDIDCMPDITKQLMAFNNGKQFRYSEELERSILAQTMKEEQAADAEADDGLVDYDSDAEVFFSDDESFLFDSEDEDDDDDDDNDDSDSDVNR